MDAAIVVFSRYGVRRATMNDIAEEAGVARQTVYNVYGNKDQVLRSLVRWYADRALARIETECANAETLGDKLDVVFEHLVVRRFELMDATPHADELVIGFNQSANEELAAAGERYRAAVEALLTPYKKQLRAAGLSPRQLSDVIEKAWIGFKRKAKSTKHLLELLDSLKRLVLTVVDTP